ncbi:GntR family transcriptional regulator [Yoonia sediminilitoris]|uniref:GntR family transcriptional regulator n=1 Tax=Yoonia sediminilitoris TaxID=1286148 RepID=A0A2T6KLK1_9RHOB|nr:GntR family transcriptional regulator [Yoonia sediminilitoris]PUB17090.1 GntR family transcriptional regulator [Yoonia sediminilitoris]RCW97385.1 GntR family transcriptional regulator [Yoonia sediminilitoris]
MNAPSFRNWKSVQDEVLRRIHAREWKPGELIPNEADLAEEFGCARSTVNRALRSLAESGLLDRRRKAGTRVAAQPVAKATLDIAVIRHEVEGRGSKYGYQLLTRELTVPPARVCGAMQTPASDALLHVRALHLADDAPYAVEDRWINIGVVPQAHDEDFATISANEWLLKYAPYTHGEIAFSAVQVAEDDADILGVAPQSAVFAIDRLTWDKDASVTKVRLLFTPGYQLRTSL